MTDALERATEVVSRLLSLSAKDVDGPFDITTLVVPEAKGAHADPAGFIQVSVTCLDGYSLVGQARQVFDDWIVVRLVKRTDDSAVIEAIDAYVRHHPVVADWLVAFFDDATDAPELLIERAKDRLRDA